LVGFNFTNMVGSLLPVFKNYAYFIISTIRNI
jgi:hypothetical protein